MPRKAKKTKSAKGKGKNDKRLVRGSLPPVTRGRRSKKQGGGGNVTMYRGPPRSLGNPGPDANLASAFALKQSGMRISNNAQKHSLMGNCQAVRIECTDCSKITVSQGAAGGASTGAVQLTGFVLSTTGSVSVTPFTTSSRLSSIASTYQYYAFREIRFRFLPLVGPSYVYSTTTPSAAECVALGISMNPSATQGSDGCGSFQAVMQLDPATGFPAWRGGQLYYGWFDGDKLWSCSSNGSTTNPDTNDTAQMALCGRWFSPPSSLAQTTITHLIEMEYVIDLYRPNYVFSSPSLTADGNLVPVDRPNPGYVLVREEDEKEPPSPAPSRRALSQPPLTRSRNVG